MTTLFTDISALVAVSNSSEPKTGADMQDLNIIHNGAVLFSENIVWTGTSDQASVLLAEGSIAPSNIVSLRGKTVLPGFVDSHTHIAFAGNRSNEFARRQRGESYEQIAASGGGIAATVNAVRSASEEEIFETAKKYALSALRHGTTTIEVKSGYGLSLESELKLLRAIKLLSQEVPCTVVPTFLGAHDVPMEYRNNRSKYIDIVCKEMMPMVAEEGLAVFCDVFADTGYFSISETDYILTAAQSCGLKLKVHADELSPFGAAELAARKFAASADHLLYISNEGIAALQKSKTVATLLPGTAYTLRLPYAPARSLIESEVVVALATDCNPGSCLTENMQTILSLACTNMRMSIEETIVAATLHGSIALQNSDRYGSISIGKSADMIILNTPDYSDLVYHFGINHVWQTWKAGVCVSS